MEFQQFKILVTSAVVAIGFARKHVSYADEYVVNHGYETITSTCLRNVPRQIVIECNLRFCVKNVLATCKADE